MGNLNNIILDKLKAPIIPEGTVNLVLMKPVSSPETADDSPHVDEMALVQLSSMGFSENRCKRALLETGNNVENALNMIMSTMDDLSLDAPIEPKKKIGYF